MSATNVPKFIVKNTFIFMEAEAQGPARRGSHVRSSSGPPCPGGLEFQAKEDVHIHSQKLPSNSRQRGFTDHEELVDFSPLVHALKRVDDDTRTATPAEMASKESSDTEGPTDGLRTPSSIGSRSPAVSPSPVGRVSFACAPEVVDKAHSVESARCDGHSGQRCRAISAPSVCGAALHALDDAHCSGALLWSARPAQSQTHVACCSSASRSPSSSPGLTHAGWGLAPQSPPAPEDIRVPIAWTQFQEHSTRALHGHADDARAAGVKVPPGRWHVGVQGSSRACKVESGALVTGSPCTRADGDGAHWVSQRAPVSHNDIACIGVSRDLHVESSPTPSRGSSCVLSSSSSPSPAPPGKWHVMPRCLPSIAQSHSKGSSYVQVVEGVRACLCAAGSMVKCVEATEGAKGWTVIAYMQPDALKVYKPQLFALAKQALLNAAKQSGTVFVLGFEAEPFSPMPLGFGAALVDTPDLASACWSSLAQGFCNNPSKCLKEHPRHRVGIHVMLKPARNRIGNPKAR